MPFGRALMAVVKGVDGLFYLVGGFNTAHGTDPPFNTFESSDPATGVWTSYPTCRHRASV